jgi:hypothetical protein
MKEDINAFFNDDEFADVFTNNGISLTGIVDDASEVIDDDGYVVGVRTTITIPQEYLQRMDVSLFLTLRGEDYMIHSHTNKGNGLVLLSLRNASV